jgi:uncharacterized protein
MHIILSSQYKTMQWKNGGGETTVIAISPEGAGLDNFDWRVSMACVASDGPFSSFSGVDRSVAILAGEGMRLAVEGRPPITLTATTTPFSFAADLPTQAHLLGGPITDLNVMTRRDRFAHRVNRLDLVTPLSVPFTLTEALLLCVDGAIRVDTSEGTAMLGAGDTLHSAEGSIWWLSPAVRSVAFLIEFTDIDPPG